MSVHSLTVLTFVLLLTIHESTSTTSLYLLCTKHQKRRWYSCRIRQMQQIYRRKPTRWAPCITTAWKPKFLNIRPAPPTSATKQDTRIRKRKKIIHTHAFRPDLYRTRGQDAE
ncbi:hypothetical protein BV25DRAFT_471513 [Artomyces pyxidatus]|uniref:Uncharacterized protein n=1 Tax=Artomyces pyxidatus TaxID=48021 RepID=A0ACB8T298_9AGAM|nr:hypothetical protein BV25DRAFT_471513 [Artomyces pyxidatus]